MNFVTCSSTSPPSFICISSCRFPIVIVFVFPVFILSLILLLLPSTLSVTTFTLVSAIRSISSANRRLFNVIPLIITAASSSPLSASLITISCISLNRPANIPHLDHKPVCLLFFHSYCTSGFTMYVFYQYHKFLRHTTVPHYPPQFLLHCETPA